MVGLQLMFSCLFSLAHFKGYFIYTYLLTPVVDVSNTRYTWILPYTFHEPHAILKA